MYRPSPAKITGISLGALYIGLGILEFRPFLSRFRSHLIGDHGDVLLQHLHCAWQWSALSDGRLADMLRLPTMHPYSSGLAFGEPLIGVSLPFAAVYAATGSSPAAFNAAVVSSFLLLGIAVFLWVRELFKEPAAGLFAAVLVVFVPWRLQYLTNLNNLTLHFAIFGAWLLSRWLRTRSLAALIGSALCFQIQLVTSTQVAIVSIYLVCIWLGVVWVFSGMKIDRTRCVQILAAGALFAALSLPWWYFFREAIEAAAGFPRTRELRMYSQTLGAMARSVGALGPLGFAAALGVPALLFAAWRGRLPSRAGLDVLGLCAGAAFLFVCAGGPYFGAKSASWINPGYYALRTLPFLDAFRAPIRLAALTPVVLSIVAAGGFAVLIGESRRRWGARGQWIWLCVPLIFVPLWPALEGRMAAPIAERPADLALAQELARLPEDAVILSLPIDLQPSGAAVDERVLIHRRSQVGGFASIIPPVFRNARFQLGQWPQSGHEVIHALGVTHVVVPDAWVQNHGPTIEQDGYRHLSSVEGRSILAAPAPRRATESGEARVRFPAVAAAGRWLTVSVYASSPRFVHQGQLPIDAVWQGPDGETTTSDARALLPGIVTDQQPILVHVPAPETPGPYRLLIDSALLSLDAEIEIQARPTAFEVPIQRVEIEPARDYVIPKSVRASASFPVDVEIGLETGPILLSTSLHPLPHRRGETLVQSQFRSGGRKWRIRVRSALSADLVPGQTLDQRWYLDAPARAGVYDLYVRLTTRASAGPPTPWVKLISELRVVEE